MTIFGIDKPYIICYTVINNIRGVSMKKNRFWALLFVFTAFLPSALFTTVSVSANSAPRYWEGRTGVGATVITQDCPLQVQKEDLHFSVNELPRSYYDNSEDFLAYSNFVTASYTFYNPTDYMVNATLAFPFGYYPSYAKIYNEENTGYTLVDDTQKYAITINGVVQEKKLRHTYLTGSTYNNEYDIDFTELATQLTDEYNTHEFFTTQMPVTKYSYKISGIWRKFKKTYAYTEYDVDKTKTRICGNTTYYNVKNGYEFSVYIIGQQLEVAPSYAIGISDSGKYKQVKGKVSLTDTKTMTFEEMIFENYDESSNISKVDYYNASLAVNDNIHKNSYTCAFRFPKENLMRWYEYDISLAPKATLINEVTAPIYPFIDDMKKGNAQYQFDYFLSPAKAWNSFGSLNITIETPYEMNEQANIQWQTTEKGYSYFHEGLPNGELTFTLIGNGTEFTQRRKTKKNFFKSVLDIFSFVISLILAIWQVIITSIIRLF